MTTKETVFDNDAREPIGRGVAAEIFDVAQVVRVAVPGCHHDSVARADHPGSGCIVNLEASLSAEPLSP